MILHGEAVAARPDAPWLVFLHGFSGDSREWRTVGDHFADFSRLYLDLPGHGGSAAVRVGGFDDLCELLRNTLLSYNILKYWLIGYSLGGRVAMYFAARPAPGLCGLVVEGGHPGLTAEDERAQRRRVDAGWAARFRHEPLERVFADWYRQPIFASLDECQRSALATLRSRNHGASLAAMLEATSLAAQPDLRGELAAVGYPFYYLCGERDGKFRALANELTAQSHVIAHAGHNAHRDNPAGAIAALAQILRH